MWYIPKIGDCSKTLTDDEVKDFVVINFGEYFKSVREKLYSKLSVEQNLYIFLTTPDEIEKFAEMMQSSSFDNCTCHFNNKILNCLDP